MKEREMMHRIGLDQWIAASRVACGALAMLVASVAFAAKPDPRGDESVLPELGTRFAVGSETSEIPDFQKHISPLMGRLGCNGRSCHGSFQGRGGFMLSLFGYDFEADHKAMLEADSGRIDTTDVDESLVLAKPIDEDMHEGGKRFDKDGWEYRVLRTWIAAGANYDAKQRKKLERLEVGPVEILFDQDKQTTSLRAVAHWEDGTREEVTGLCRFHTNDDAIATIDESGNVTCTGVGDTHVVVSYDNAVVPVAVIRPVSQLTGDDYPQRETRTEVDRLIAVKLQKLGIVPSEICSDAEFLRRASLDISGTLPTAADAAAFIADQSSDKRQRKVEELLSSPGYAAWWTTRFCDWTGNSDAQLNNVSPIRQAPTQHWYEWIHRRVEENMPYDEMVEGIVVAQSREEGESYREYCEAMGAACRNGEMDGFADRPGLTYFWARRNFRQTEDRAIGFAYSFLGIRIQCAQCHKHPFDQWSKQDFDEFKNLFQTVGLSQKPRDKEDLEQYEAMMTKMDSDLKGNQLRRELQKEFNKGAVIPFPEVVERPIRGNAKMVRKPGQKARRVVEPPTAKLLGGDYVQLDEMAREKLMQWLRDPSNPYFAKAIVNRVWANYFGSGIVDPVDDLNLANPPSNAPLMDYLADGFIESGYDMKWLHRTIVDSDAYQRSWQTNETNALDVRNFSHFVPRRLPAETLYDAILVATASDKQAAQLCSSRDGRAVGIASSSPRNNGRGSSYALQVFGRSIRESNCDCDRSEDPNLLQTVYLQNDEDVTNRLYDRNGWLAEQMKSLGQPMLVSDAALAKAKQQGNEARQRQIQMMKKRRQELVQTLVKVEKNSSISEEQLKIKTTRINQQIAQVSKRIKALQTGEVQDLLAGKAAELDSKQLTNLVQQAYLRTVARYPEPEELSSSLAYIEAGDSVASGVGDLLWALLNTKEFVLNH
ncbi:hypothetical protein Poly24_02540 [Rosistilla carotiformis]|uniref:BIG2 domain-containing protein n=1 Tax=Rosistilla carotiformis TaxID=2528017 RepID=A0A518JM49_9BACT|nr:DUF1549 and DUF1553 domain-containing protein [Rosistilla carotiformis]QDV66567.1 hypothetical protein Poly24_02540 [Rosistilla carotiformis]